MTTHRSHPPTLETLARRLLVDHALVSRGDVVLAAVSGGPDSMALLHVLARLRERFGFSLVAHGVDHGLRPEAAAELGVARSLARDLGVVFDVTAVHPGRGSNLQARARAARWEALRAAARRSSAASIATGHHADDRAETVLLRLLSGSGPRGLACLPPRDGDRIRPLLLARRADVLAHVRRHAIRYVTDPSNHDGRFARVRVRRELLPLLESMSPSIVAHLNGLADDLASMRDALPAELRRAHRLAAMRKGGEDVVVRLSEGDALVRFADGGFVITKKGAPPGRGAKRNP